MTNQARARTKANKPARVPGRKSAEEIYRQQNTFLHRAMSHTGLPYQANKEEWLVRITMIIGREVQGLSALTLGERDLVLKRLQEAYRAVPGATDRRGPVASPNEGTLAESLAVGTSDPQTRIKNPAVPRTLRDWKKGDAPADMAFKWSKDPQVRLILALWAELGQESDTVRRVIKARYGVDDLTFMDGKQRQQFIGYLKARLKAAGRPARYHE